MFFLAIVTFLVASELVGCATMMISLRVAFLAVLGLVTVSMSSATTTLSRPTEERLFSEWKVAYDKSYDSDEEADLRMQIWMENHGAFDFFLIQVVYWAYRMPVENGWCPVLLSW